MCNRVAHTYIFFTYVSNMSGKLKTEQKLIFGPIREFAFSLQIYFTLSQYDFQAFDTGFQTALTVLHAICPSPETLPTSGFQMYARRTRMKETG